MVTENGPAPSTSATHLPSPVELPDEAPSRGPATAPANRGAQLARLGDRIAELSARIQAATHELLVLIREFDEREGWDGCVSCAQWLGWRAGLAPGAAREHVRVARALGKLPKLSDAMRRGKISYSKVRAVSRVATPENEDDLLYVCQAGTAAHVERIARAWRRIDRNVEQAEERRRQASRELRTWVDEDGMVVVRGRLTPEVGSVLRRALEAACDQARRAPAAGGGEDGEVADSPAGAEVEAADASPHAAARTEREAAAAAADEAEPTLAQRQADAIGVVAEAALAGGLDRGTAGDRYQVVMHVDAEALAEPRDVPAGTSGDAASTSMPRAGGDRVPAGTSGDAASGSKPRAGGDRVHPGTPATARATAAGPGDGSSVDPAVPGRAGRARRRRRRTSGPCPTARTTPATGSQTVLEEAGGIHVSAETARRLACDAATVTMSHGPGGKILDVGRRTGLRTISPTAAGPRSTTSCCCAAGTTGRCMKRATGSRSTPPATCGSCARTGDRSRRRRRRRRGRARRCSPPMTAWRRRGSRSTPTPRRRPGGASGSTSTTR